MSPGGREMVISRGEREERRAWSQKFTYTLQNMQNVDYFTK